MYAASWLTFQPQPQNKKGIPKKIYIYTLKISYIFRKKFDLTYYHNSLLPLKNFSYFTDKKL